MQLLSLPATFSTTKKALLTIGYKYSMPVPPLEGKALVWRNGTRGWFGLPIALRRGLPA
jgi:hypothetical protein